LKRKLKADSNLLFEKSSMLLVALTCDLVALTSKGHWLVRATKSQVRATKSIAYSKFYYVKQSCS